MGQVKAEKPVWYLGVIAGAVLRTLDFIAAGAAEFVGYLEKGQLPPAKLTLTTAQQSFVLEGERLSLSLLRPSDTPIATFLVGVTLRLSRPCWGADLCLIFKAYFCPALDCRHTNLGSKKALSI